MTLRLPSLLLLGSLALVLFAETANAQYRASNTLYLSARVGATTYAGDIDGVNESGSIGDYLGASNVGFGGELGYQFSPSLALGFSYLYGQYDRLDKDARVANDGTVVQEVQARLRYLPFSKWRVSPYVVLGGLMTLSTPASDTPGIDTGFGAVTGLGLDVALGGRLSLFVEGTTSFVFPDEAVDGANPGANIPLTGFDPAGDDMDFDILGFLGGGLRFAFKSPVIKVDATIDGPTSLQAGTAGTYSAFVNDDATGPCTYTWNWGDGTTSTGLTASKTYAQAGTYTATFTAACAGNTDTETLLITVTAPPPPPVEAPSLANCTATPATAGIGEAVRFGATVTGTQPLSFAYDFGDGNTSNTLRATHTFTQAGTYTVTLTATNEGGSDQCTIVVEVGDRFCAEVNELNSVNFGFNRSTLTDEARTRLNENVEVLRRCPELCVVVTGYTDDVEGDKVRLSTRRAAEVKAFYVQQGIDMARIREVGGGQAPDANNKEDPGPGDANARRAESAPVPCATLGGN